MGNLSCVSCRQGRRCVYSLDRSTSSGLQSTGEPNNPVNHAPNQTGDHAPNAAQAAPPPKVVVHRPAQFVEGEDQGTDIRASTPPATASATPPQTPQHTPPETPPSTSPTIPETVTLECVESPPTIQDVELKPIEQDNAVSKGRTVRIPAHHEGEVGTGMGVGVGGPVTFRRIHVSPSEDEAIAKVMERGSVVRRSTRKTDPKCQPRPKVHKGFQDEALKRIPIKRIQPEVVTSAEVTSGKSDAPTCEYDDIGNDEVLAIDNGATEEHDKNAIPSSDCIASEKAPTLPTSTPPTTPTTPQSSVPSTSPPSASPPPTPPSLRKLPTPPLLPRSSPPSSQTTPHRQSRTPPSTPEPAAAYRNVNDDSSMASVSSDTPPSYGSSNSSNTSSPLVHVRPLVTVEITAAQPNEDDHQHQQVSSEQDDVTAVTHSKEEEDDEEPEVNVDPVPRRGRASVSWDKRPWEVIGDDAPSTGLVNGVYVTKSNFARIGRIANRGHNILIYHSKV